MRSILPDSLPQRLRQAVRVFCAKRRLAIAVYAVQRADPETGAYYENEICLILWLREPNDDFYNDFRLMAQRSLPKGVELVTAAMNSEEVERSDFLKTCPPLWPVMR